MSCSIKRDKSGAITSVLDFNGRESILFQKLLERNNNKYEQSMQEYLYAYTTQFKSYFGFFEDENNGINAFKLYENGEPRVEYIPSLNERSTSPIIKGINPEFQKMIVDSLVYKFFETKRLIEKNGKNINVGNILGRGSNPGSLAISFLKGAYTNEDGEVLDVKVLTELAKREAAIKAIPENTVERDQTIKEFDEYMESFDSPIYAEFPDVIADEFGEMSEKELEARRELYFNVYNNWDTQVDKYGNENTGWRDLVKNSISSKGLDVIETSYIAKDSFNDDIEIDLSEDIETTNRLHGKNRLEEDPFKTVSNKMKELLGTIPASNKNILGFRTFIPIEDVYAELSTAFANKTTFQGMLVALKNLAAYKPQYKDILDFFNGLTRAERAGMVYTFGLSHKQFLATKILDDGDVLIYNPAKSNIENSAAISWRDQSVSRNVFNPRSLFKVVQDLEGEDVLMLANPEVGKRIFDNYKTVIDAVYTEDIGVTTESNNIVSKPVEALAKLLWDMSIQYGNSNTLEESMGLLQRYFNDGVFTLVKNNETGEIEEGSVKGKELYKQLVFPPKEGHGDLKLSYLVSSIIDFTTVGKVRPDKFVGTKKQLKNFFITHGKIIQHLASPTKYLNTAKVESFRSPSGKSVYPNNLMNHLDFIVNTLTGVDGSKLLKEYLSDPFLNPNLVEHRSILITLLSNSKFKGDFLNYSISAIDKENLGEVGEYENLSDADLRALKLNLYLNNGNKNIFYAQVPTQADRKDFSTIPFVRNSRLGDYGIGISRKGIIQSMIIQDLMRIKKAKNDIEELSEDQLIEGYHFKRDKDNNIVFVDEETGELFGNAFGRAFAQLDMRDASGDIVFNDEVIAADEYAIDGARRLSDIAYDIVHDPEIVTDSESNALNEAVNKMTDAALEYFNEEAKRVLQLVTPFQSRLSQGGLRAMGGLTKAVNEYVFDDFVARNEIIKLTRGSKAYHKNLVDLYKRMGHLRSPGRILAMQSDAGINSKDAPSDNYKGKLGLPEKLNTVLFEDVRLNLGPLQIDRKQAEQDARIEGLATLKEILQANGMPWSESKAQKIIESYLPGEIEGTDALGIITLDTYRLIQAAKQMWTPAMEEAYWAYKKAPAGAKKFVYLSDDPAMGKVEGESVPILPLKGYFEDLALMNESKIPISHKNHFHTIIEEYTKDFPEMDRLRSWMEDNNVHIANFVSGSKLAKNGVKTLSEGLADLETTTITEVNSRGLRFPQEIPYTKDKTKVAFNRQLRKNSMTNVYPSNTYVYNAGLETATPTDGETLLKIYHGAIEERLRREVDSINKSLGVAAYREALESGDPKTFKEAKLKMLQNVRNILNSEIQSRNLPEVYSRALQIIPDEAGNPSFAIDLDFPVYGLKFQHLIMSLFNNNAYKMKMQGSEMVQIAQIGGHALTNELKFYSIEEDEITGVRLGHAEVMIKPSTLRNFGIDPGQSLESINEELRRIIAYRIPHQEKLSTLMMNIVGFLPENYEKSILLPAEITKLTGADFDVDKLFVLFPEVENKDGVLKKVQVPYNELASGETSLASLSMKQLNNIMLDSIEAVGTNPAHILESLAPMDDQTLKSVKTLMEEEYPELVQSDEFSSSETEIAMMRRNQLGNALRGLWANFNAGAAVAQYGKIPINPKYNVVVDGVAYSETTFSRENVADTEISDPAMYVNEMGSRYLSSAVDAAKEMLQYALNDTKESFPVRVHLLTSYPDEVFIARFLNTPIIKDLTDTHANKYDSDPRMFFKAFNEVAVRWKVPKINVDGKIHSLYKGALESGSYNLNKEELVDLPSTPNNLTDKDTDLNRRLLVNYRLWRNAGQEKARLFKAITPDSLDGIGTIHNIESYMSKVSAYERHTDGSVFIGDPAKQYLVGDAYGLSRGFYNMFESAQKTMADIFPVLGSAAIQNFKVELEAALNTTLTAEQHRDVSKRLQLMMLAMPGSPLADFFSETHIDINYNPKVIVENVLADGKTTIQISTILDRINRYKNAYPGFANNPLIAALSVGDTSSSSTPVLNLDTNTLITKDDMALGLYTLMYNAEVYSYSVEDKNALQSLGEDIAMHFILQNGMLGYNFAEIIPTEFWTRRRAMKYGKRAGQLTNESPIEFYRKVSRQLSASNALIPFMDAFIAYSGNMYSGGSALLNSKRVKRAQPIMELEVSPYDNYVRVYNQADKQSYIYKRFEGNKFKMLAPFGDGRNYFEIFTRTASSVNMEEKILTRSAFPFNNKFDNTIPLNLDYTQLNTEQNNESYLFDQEQLEVAHTNPTDTQDLMRIVNRLQTNFRRKGVSVSVELDPTLESVGVLRNENGKLVIYLNPSKATQETVFHEFAHVFIDTLGVNHPLVQELIAEAEKLGIGDRVRALYTQRAIDQGLTEAQIEEKLAKEIAATIIGLEGAKVETKKPSKIQQIINRILRAIAKLLGITNYRAAEVAQELWDESFDFGNLVDSFSDYEQESLAKENKAVEKIINDSKTLLKSYIIRLQSQPNPNPVSIKELNRQIALLDNIEKFEDFNEFIQYTVRTVNAAKANFKDLQRIYEAEDLSEQEILNGLKKLYHIHSTIDALVDGKTNESILKRLSAELQREVMNESSKSSKVLMNNAEMSLARVLSDINFVQSQYIEYGADLYSNLLYKMAPPTLNMQIKKLINNIEKNRRLIGIKKDRRYEEIMALQKAGKITPEEAKNQLIELNVEQLKQRQISVSSIKRMLLDEMDDSSGFSALFDPIIFSNDMSIQLHALRLKEGNQLAAENTELVQTVVSDAYLEFLGTGTDLNPAKTNEKLLETIPVEIPIPKTNETQIIQVQALVQKYLVEDYITKEIQMRKDANKKYMVEAKELVKELVDGGMSEKQAWRNSIVQKLLEARNKEINEWYKNNSTAIPKAEEMLKELTDRKNKVASEIDAILNDPNENASMNQKLKALNSELADLNKEISRVFKNGQFRGKLAMPNDNYINPKYKALEADPKAFKYYNSMLEVYKQHQAKVMGGSFKLPINAWEDFSYALPSILESTIDSWMQGKGITSMKNWINDTFFMVDTDTDFGALTDLNGEKLKTIPVFFSNPLEANKASKDVASSIIFFSHMANMYEQKSKLLAEVMIMKDLMNERGVIETTSSGIPIVNEIARRMGIDKAKKGTTNNRQKQLNDFVDMYFFGERKKSYKGKILGKEISIGKITSAIASFTALNALGLNYMQATNQAIMDNYRLVEEAGAGEFMTAKGLLKAKAEYIKNLGALKDVGSIDPKSPLAKYLRYVDAFQSTEELGSTSKAGAKIKKLPGQVFMGFQTMAEAETAVTRAIAVGYNIKVKLENGKMTNLYDAYMNNEDLSKAKRVLEDGTEATINRRQIANILGGIFKRTNQLKGEFNRVAAERIPGLDLVILFRRYMVPSIRRRFGHGGKETLHLDAELGTVTQGMYISFANYLYERLKAGIIGGAGTFKRLSDMEKANVKRTMIEAGGALLAFLAYTTLANMDDDEENDTVVFWAYQMRRLQLELTAFNPISFVTSGELLRLLKSPTAGVRSLSKLQSVFTDLYYYTGYELGFDVDEKDVFYQRSQGNYEKGDLKLEASFDKFLIGRAGLLQSDNAREALKWFNQPPI